MGTQKTSGICGSGCSCQLRERRPILSGDSGPFGYGSTVSIGAAPGGSMPSVVSASDGAVSPPTVFPELNELLGELVARVQSILAGNFVGAYLTGSFALGAGDLHSD